MVKKDFAKYSSYVMLFYVFIFLVVTFYFSEMVNYIFQKARIEDFPILGEQFTLSLLISVIAVGSGFIYIKFINKKIDTSVFETANELAHVDWPDGEETKSSTVVTIAFSIMFSLLLAAMDLIWAFFTKFLV